MQCANNDNEKKKTFLWKRKQLTYGSKTVRICLSYDKAFTFGSSLFYKYYDLSIPNKTNYFVIFYNKMKICLTGTISSSSKCSYRLFWLPENR